MARQYPHSRKRAGRFPEGIYHQNGTSKVRATVKRPGKKREYIGLFNSIAEALSAQEAALLTDGSASERVVHRIERVVAPEVRFLWGVAFPKEVAR